MFSREHCKTFKNTCFEEHLRTTASLISFLVIMKLASTLPLIISSDRQTGKTGPKTLRGPRSQNPIRTQDPKMSQDPARTQDSMRTEDPLRAQDPTRSQEPMRIQDPMRTQHHYESISLQLSLVLLLMIRR